MNASLFLGGLGLGVVAALAGAALPARIRRHAAALLTTAACVAAIVPAAGVLTSGIPITAHSDAILPMTGVLLSLDPLGAVFVITAAAVGIAASWYAVGYLAHDAASRTITALLPLFITSLLLVPAAASVATFMAAWELMALSSLLLLLTGHYRSEARNAAQWYATMTHVGAAAILLAFVLLSAHAGGQSFAAIRAAAGTLGSGWRTLAFLLALAGFASKAGAVPLHVWLPRAHPEAPSPVSALMSGAMVNLGVYGIVRTGDYLLGHGELWWWLTVAGIGVASALFGALNAAASSDLKRLLAYSTVDNVGLILTGVGASGALAVTGHRALAGLILAAALFHLVNHSAFKGCLFLAAGSVQHVTGTRDLDRLGGLLRRVPVTAGMFGIGTLAICALPPFSGFASEWLLLQGFLRGFTGHNSASSVALLAGTGVLALTGGLTVVAFVKAFGIGFLGQPRTPPAATEREAPRTMLAGMVLLAVPSVVFGLIPGIVVRWLLPAVATALGGNPAATFAPGIKLAISGSGDVLQPALLAAGLLGALVAASAVIRLRGRTKARRAEAWGCGGAPQTARMEYTATSFAEPLQRVFAEVLRADHDLDPRPLAGSRYFDQAISYHSRVDDAVERSWYRPLIDLTRRWGEMARLAQNGSMHRYLAYGFAALLAVLVALA